MSYQRQFSSVLSKSKKIQKSVVSPKAENHKKYKTFNSNIRKSIVSSLRNTLINMEIVHPEDINMSSNELLQLVEKIDLEDYNTILQEILKKHIFLFEPDVRSLRKWRRKIKEWIMASERPEGRGHFLIPHGKLSEFKQHMIPEITKMSTRNFDVLKQKAKKVFKIINLRVPERTCSKHWWYRFLERNTDVKDAWEMLPQRRRRNQASNYFSDSESPTQIEETSFENKEFQFEIDLDILDQEDNHASMNEKSCLIEDLEEEIAFPQYEILEENFSSKLPDFTLNPLASQDEWRFERLVSWREARASTTDNSPFMMEEDQRDSLPELYRNHFMNKKDKIIELLEDALRMGPQFDENIPIWEEQTETKVYEELFV